VDTVLDISGMVGSIRSLGIPVALFSWHTLLMLHYQYDWRYFQKGARTLLVVAQVVVRLQWLMEPTLVVVMVVVRD
jgi:hypothetical protein